MHIYQNRLFVLMKLFAALYFYFLAIALPYIATAQTRRTDSLKALINKTADTEARLNLLFLFCEERQSLNSDTLYAYASLARQFAQAQHNDLLLLKADYYLDNVLLKNGLFDSVIAKCEYSIQWLEKHKAPPLLWANFNFLKAQALTRSERYKEALQLNYQLLSRAESNGDTLTQVKAKTGIGWVNMEMNQNKEAIIWLNNALATTSNQQAQTYYSIIYANLASTYNNLGKYDSATYFVNKAIAGSRQNQQLTYLANALYIQADIFMNIRKNLSAEGSLHEALAIRRQIGDPFYIVSDLTQLAYFYANTGQPAKGISLAKQGIEIAASYRIDAKLPILYAALADNYKVAGDYKQYSQIQEKIILLKDSLYQKNSAEAMRSLQARYDLQRKENIIIQQQLNIVKQDYLFYGMLILFFFLLLLIFIFYRNYRKRQQIKMERVLKEQQQKETIAIIKAEEAERKRIAADLHDNLGAYAAAISANIKSFKDVGQQNHPFTHRIEENVAGMVSQLNNTIWVLKKETQLLTEISDRFKVWMQRLMHNYPDIQYDFIEQIENDRTLNSAGALNLFLLLQEGVTNAVRHSRCSHITITFISKIKWVIRVTDNGTAHNPEGFVSGNGIQNMKERANSCGWKIIWKKNGEKGTIVSIHS